MILLHNINIMTTMQKTIPFVHARRCTTALLKTSLFAPVRVVFMEIRMLKLATEDCPFREAVSFRYLEALFHEFPFSFLYTVFEGP